MPKTRLQLINSVLQLVGENQLLDSTGNLGQLVADTINTAIVNIAGETRANVFEQVLAQNVTASDYLTSALTLPANTLQVYSVLLRISTGLAAGDQLIPLEYLPLESIPLEPSYSVVGSEVFVSPMIARPFTLRVHVIAASSLPTSDSADSGLPDVVIPVIQHAAASILALSYLDDPNQAAVHRNIAEQLTEKLRKQYGNNRAKTFNIGGSGRAAGFGFGGVSSVTGGVAYAPLESPPLTGTPTVNGQTLATDAELTAATAPLLSSATAAATYLTQVNAASTYLTQVNAAATYAPIPSTPPLYDNDTSIATTAFVQQVCRPYFRAEKNTTQTQTTDNTLITFNSEVNDSNSTWVTSRFTVPAGGGGLYLFSGHGYLVNNAGTQQVLGIIARVNGTIDYRMATAVIPASSGVSLSLSALVVNLSAGDYIELYARNFGSGTSYTVGEGSLSTSYFTGFRLGV